MSRFIVIKKIGIFILLLALVINNNGMIQPEKSTKRPLEEGFEDFILPKSKYGKDEKIISQASVLVPSAIESVSRDLRQLIILALSYADDKAQAQRLQAMIDGTPITIQDVGQDKQARLYNATESIRNILMSSKSFSSILNDQKFTGQLITSLANTFKYPVVDVAIALGTDAASRWIAHRYDEITNIKDSAWERIWTAAAQGEVSVLRFLLTYASDETRSYLVNTTFSKTSPLMIAVKKNQLDVITYLLRQKNIDIEKKDIYSNTPLYYAATNGNEEIFNELVKAGANINQTNSDNKTALQIAVIENKLPIINRLIELQADLNHQDNAGNTALMVATTKNNKSIVRALIDAKADLNKQDNNGYTALIIAVLNNFQNLALKLIKAGADLNKQNNAGETPLMLATIKNNELLVSALIAAKADVNKQDKNGYTALIFAAYNNFDNIALKLIETGADVNTQNNKGETPLMWATYKNNESIVSALIAAGANPYLANSNNRTALQFGLDTGTRQVIQAIFSSHLLKDKKVEIDSGLVLATSYGNFEAVKFLIEQGADVNKYRIRDESALKIARKLDSPSKDAIIKILIDHGAKE